MGKSTTAERMKAWRKKKENKNKENERKKISCKGERINRRRT